MKYVPYAYMYDTNTVLFGVKDAAGNQLVGDLRNMADAELEAAALEGRDMDRQRTASFAPGAHCSDLDAHPFSGVVSAGDY